MSLAPRVFSPFVSRPPRSVLAKLAPSARVSGDDAAAWQRLQIAGSGMKIELRCAGVADAGDALLSTIRDAQREIVQRVGATPTSAAFRLHRFVGRARHVYTLEGLDLRAPEQQSLLIDVAHLVGGVAQIEAGFLDTEARWLLDKKGRAQAGAALPQNRDAEARRARSQRTARGLGLDVAPGVAPLEGVDEAVTAQPIDVVWRALALWRTFRETCGAPVLWIEQQPDVQAHVESALSETERRAIAAGDKDVGGAALECAWALCFALGAVELGPVGQWCVAERAMEALDAITRAGNLERRGLRPTAELLDAADLYQCLAWAAAERGGALPAPMDAYAVSLRLKALRWALVDQYAGWDEVSSGA